MVLTVKGKILMTVLTVVFLFALFILFYFPAKQEKDLLENYNAEVENFTKTVALGVKIALTEQNFEGVETAIDFVRNDSRLVYVSLIQTDSIPNPDGNGYQVENTIFKSFPENANVDPDANSDDFYIIKKAVFNTPMMSGFIQLSFTTEEIIKSRNQIRLTSIIASLIVFAIGLIIGYLLARNISRPVLALRDAANRVGEGDLTQSVKKITRDEIGELSIAFNKMVRDLGVEASLERVRTKALAMEHSEDLEKTVSTVLIELNKTGLATDYSGIGLIDASSQTTDYWTSRMMDQDSEIFYKGQISLHEHPFLQKILDSWEKQENLSYVLEGEDYFNYHQLFESKNLQLPAQSSERSDHPVQYCYAAMFASGVIAIFRDEPLEEADMQILRRFADVFNLAYTRFLDLKNAEINARKEKKQASLNRVRGEIASMRTPEDLQRITPIIWKELKLLGVPLIRCGVFIADQTHNELQSFLSSPSGESLGVFILPKKAHDIASKIIDHWLDKEAFIEHWSQEDFVEFMNKMIDLGRIKSAKSYLGEADAPESLDLHFFPFNQGMLYVGSPNPLSEEEFDLVKDLTQAFSIAYARYDDFTLLEIAKNKMERALNDLKSTQDQLIQSEKMASLGELTAGIAHEIQNPLNFVNNFSEVSVELVDEMNEELENGDIEEAKAIASDLKGNLSKINLHGKRADSIVKGMLEHSRASVGDKVPTNINDLAEEYLRLSYHGIRAKDKSFNSDFQLDLDPTLPILSIYPQDIGRVILNMVNNSFYAVNEKAKESGDENYQPCVKVITKHVLGGVEVTVEDNGPGIPKEIINKIFQPFFTTKPTGKGTGLGLSLSYDIIKSHKGDLRVKSSTGNEQGTAFTIYIPE